MARTAEPRQPAAPVSRRQLARRVAILRAAGELGAREGLAGVQMLDVAKEAGVAIATLYRYFPSKTHLFTAVLEWRIELFLEDRAADDADAEGGAADGVGEVAETLIALTVKLLDSPLLASAVALSSFTEYSSAVPNRYDIAGSCLGQAVLRLLGVHEPRDEDRSTVRLLIYSWWGLFVAAQTEEISVGQVEADLRLAVRLILAPYGDRDARSL
ncbi:TetR family transcriptional regulator [Streptomyces sp. NBC_01275]|uniref:TetR/AcrR family transcriptional regulator n=1 Tax=Streptomyces sp. NBC_01275 TaxID=2903807 RepID=UPI00225070CE|nr:TetR/AcrR family transcriptional regulator [Streptomyces sp. NBC_01275]MCX4767715.1 TetR family transcriptional regulator [Streptomyces sp. NBC_01275]